MSYNFGALQNLSKPDTSLQKPLRFWCKAQPERAPHPAPAGSSAVNAPHCRQR
jgi:hypothetical protein